MPGSTIAPVDWTGVSDRWLRAHPVVPDGLLALAAAVVVGPTSIDILQVAESPAWVLRTAGTCAVVLLATVALRRAATGTAFLLASLAMLVTVALPNTTVRPAALGLPATDDDMDIPLFFLPSSAVYLVLLHAVAAHRPRSASLPALGIALAGALLCIARTATAYGVLPAGWLTLLLALLALVAAVAGTWAVGRLHLDRRRRLVAEAAAAAERAATDERRRIARDMHDIVAHSLAVIVRQAEGGSAIASTSPERAARTLSVIADTAREALTDMRGTLRLLREAAPHEAGGPSLDAVPALVERVRETGVDVRLVQRGPADAVTAGAATASYRLVQEALTNAVKHAGPQATVTVTIATAPDGTVVAVDDDGGHARCRQAVPGAGVGLRGIRERVHAAGGSFEAGPSEGGFRVRARFRADDGPA